MKADVIEALKKGPAALVRRYLEAVQARDLVTAKACLAPSFRMTFPGDVAMTTLEELIAWSQPQYRSVAKRFEAFDVSEGQGSSAVVHCHGTLHGTWPDGTPFAGIRFIDRFEIDGGLIVRQQVWNDMAEIRARRAQAK
jgi:hypothetical protein